MCQSLNMMDDVTPAQKNWASMGHIFKSSDLEDVLSCLRLSVCPSVSVTVSLYLSVYASLFWAPPDCLVTALQTNRHVQKDGRT